MLKLLAENLLAADRSAQDGFADDRPQPQRFRLVQQLLAVHSQFDPTFDPVSYTHLTLPTNREV